MAGKKAATPREPFGKFGDKEKTAYLELLANGVRKGQAAKGVGVSRELVRLYRNENPGFDEEEKEHEKLANEQVENAMFKSALNGNVTAQQVWLYNRDPETWKDRRKPDDAAGASDSFDVARLTPNEREELRQAINKAFGTEAEIGAGPVQRNGFLPH